MSKSTKSAQSTALLVLLENKRITDAQVELATAYMNRGINWYNQSTVDKVRVGRQGWQQVAEWAVASMVAAEEQLRLMESPIWGLTDYSPEYGPCAGLTFISSRPQKGAGVMTYEEADALRVRILTEDSGAWQRNNRWAYAEKAWADYNR